MEFKNRVKEIEHLEKFLKSNKFEFLILYGRRRVGKTELILNATKNKKRIYYLATSEKNLERFYEVLLKYDPFVSNLKMDFEVLIDYLKDKIEIIVIDEFQNLIKEDKNILNIFQSLIDTKLKDSNLKLVILGSSVSIISSKVLSYQSPLYGRRTESIKLKPVSFIDLKKFFPKSDFKELLEIYGFADGIPYYLIRREGNFWDWISKELIEEKSFLRDEIDFLMRYEFDDPSTYKLILEAIANGKNKMNEIKDFIKLQRTDLSPYLKNLIEVDLIKREVSITENLKSRKGRYYLKDNFIKFWFKFVYPNLSSIESEIFKISIIKNNYSEYLGPIFEDVCKEFLVKSKLFNFTKIGRWWYKDIEIDIVAINKENKNNPEIIFSECKWKKNINAEKIIFKLIEKAEKVDFKRKKETYVIFAKSFKKKIKEFEGKKVYCFDLNDLEKMMGKI